MKDEFIYPFDKSYKEEVDQILEDDYAELPPTDIVAFNETRSCADILRMYKSNQIVIQPYFQREVVWSKPAQSRFIDSLIKQLPIPSMCFSHDFQNDERFVIDGLQRIQTIINFLSKDDWDLSKLEDIDPNISGKTVREIKSSHLNFYSRVQNLSIPITVIRCNHQKKSHLEYLFTIFHRLNSGGSKLNNQEIRNCIYSGSFNEFLKETSKYKPYKELFDIKGSKKYRFAFEELNLRFLALSASHKSYNGRLSKWLNDFMYTNRFLSEKEIDKFRVQFEDTIDLIYTNIFDSKAAGKLSKAVIEAVYVGVSKNLNQIRKINTDIKSRYDQLRADPLFSSDALKDGVAQKSKVIKRLDRAIKIFKP